MKKIFLFLISLSFFANAQNTKFSLLNKFVTNYSQEDYGNQFNAQNWSITQDKDGILYFGNAFNILTYDGKHWDAIPSNSNYITSLYCTENNHIFWGGNGDFGYIETDIIGKQTCVSLADRLPELDRYFSPVRRTLEYNNQITFFTEESIFIYNIQTDSISIIYPEESFHLDFVTNNELYARDRSYGLKKFDGQQFINLNGGDIFKDYGVFEIFYINKNEYLIVTQELGLFTYKPSDIKEPIKTKETADNKVLKNAQIIGAKQLQDGNIALNTASNGVIIINKQGEIKSRINLSSGIADNDVKEVYQAKDGKIWLATNNGISSVNYPSPISFYLNDEKTGLQGSVKALVKYKDDLFVGTTSGLFVFDQNKTTTYKKIRGLSKNITALCVTEDDLIIGTNEAVYIYNKNGQIQRAFEIAVSEIIYSKETKHLYLVGSNGFYILSKQEKWKITKVNNDLHLNSISAVLFPNQESTEQIWIGTISNGLWNISIDKENNIDTEYYKEEDGISNIWVKPYIYDEKLYAGTNEGLLKLITEEEALAEFTDSTQLESKAYFFNSELAYLDSGTVTFLNRSDTLYWLVYNGMLAQYSSQRQLRLAPFSSIDIGKINTILPISNNEIWIGSDEGIVHVLLDSSINYLAKPNIRIGKFTFSNDSIFFYNTKQKSEVKIDYSYNSFNIKFSSTFNENGKTAKFSYMLDGFDDEWSKWSDFANVEYKKIREGDYIFKVKSRNIYGVESNISKIDISIRAPWYRSVWAFIFYFIIVSFIVYLIFLWRLKKLKERQKELEKIVEERTREVVLQKQEIEKTHEEITDSINYAKRLQDAILPSEAEINKYIPNHFILFKPKDVVSGDFYWFETLGDYAFIAAADSTGHGVPGAMVSVVCSNALNRAVNEYKLGEPSKILDKTRELVIETFTKHGEEVKDGMDIALFAIHNKTVIFSGANNPLWIVRRTKYITEEQKNDRKTFWGEEFSLIEIKANKQPVGLYQEIKAFEQKEIELMQDDTLYIFSDGYADQFGGPKGKKFKYKPFKKLLVDNVSKSLFIQKDLLNNAFETWRGEQEQVDDVVVIGVKY